MERYLGPGHQSTLTTRHIIRRLSSPAFSLGPWTPAVAITQAIHCNAVDHARAHSHDGGSCCRASDAPGGPGLSVAHDSCPSRPVGPHGGPGDGTGASTPHTSWSAEGDRRRLHHEQQVTVLFRSALAVLTIISGAGVCDAGVTRELARTCGPCNCLRYFSDRHAREYRQSLRLAASSTALANQRRPWQNWLRSPTAVTNGAVVPDQRLPLALDSSADHDAVQVADVAVADVNLPAIENVVVAVTFRGGYVKTNDFGKLATNIA